MKLVFPDGEHSQVLLGPGRNRVGSAADSHVRLTQAGISPEHCVIDVNLAGVALLVADGCAVNVNSRVVDAPIALHVGDTLAFNGVQAQLVALAVRATADGALTAPVPATHNPQITAVRPALPRLVLRGVAGAAFGRLFPLQGETTLGRAAECAIRIDDVELSRAHARLTPNALGIWVSDLGSVNGSYINGQRVQAAQAVPGDELAFAALRFQLLAPGMHDPASVPLPPRAGGAGMRGATPRGLARRWALALTLLLGSAAAAVWWVLLR